MVLLVHLDFFDGVELARVFDFEGFEDAAVGALADGLDPDQAVLFLAQALFPETTGRLSGRIFGLFFGGYLVRSTSMAFDRLFI